MGQRLDRAACPIRSDRRNLQPRAARAGESLRVLEIYQHERRRRAGVPGNAGRQGHGKPRVPGITGDDSYPSLYVVQDVMIGMSEAIGKYGREVLVDLRK